MLYTSVLDKLGNLVSTIGSRDFGSVFFRTFRDMLDIDECTVFSFSSRSVPQWLVVESECDEARCKARKLANDYVTGGYLLDPNITRHEMKTSATTHVIDAANLRGTSFGHHYYDDPALAYELVIMGELDDTLYYLSFYRKTCRPCFAEKEIGVAGSIANFVIKTVNRHKKIIGANQTESFIFGPQPGEKPIDARERSLIYLRDLLISGPHKLSLREAEVCAGIAMGYSTLAIGLNYSITPNTVATHRKRAYAKLGISSQNELFVRYFSTVRAYNASLQ